MINFIQNNWETIVAAASPFAIFLIPLLQFIKKNTKLEKLVDKIKSDLNINREDMNRIFNATDNLKEIGTNFLNDVNELKEKYKDDVINNVKKITDETNLIISKMNDEIKKNRVEANSLIKSFNDFVLNLGVDKVKEMIIDETTSTLPEERPSETDNL